MSNKKNTIKNNINFPIPIGENNPLVIIGGINVLENLETSLEVGFSFKKSCEKLNKKFIFKASFDKANRSSFDSFRGPGLEKGLEWLKIIKSKLNCPILTDIHEPSQVEKAAKICDVLQLPAFLARQTDLVKALAESKRPVHIKKPQFIYPYQMKEIVTKFEKFGCKDVVLCERGSTFGYNNQIVDLLGLSIMREVSENKPISFDVTHSLQYRKNNSQVSKGRRGQSLEIAKAAIAVGIDAIFIEAHPKPSQALCDGECAIPTNKVHSFLQQIIELDEFVRSQKKLEIE